MSVIISNSFKCTTSLIQRKSALIVPYSYRPLTHFHKLHGPINVRNSSFLLEPCGCANNVNYETFPRFLHTNSNRPYLILSTTTTSQANRFFSDDKRLTPPKKKKAGSSKDEDEKLPFVSQLKNLSETVHKKPPSSSSLTRKTSVPRTQLSLGTAGANKPTSWLSSLVPSPLQVEGLAIAPKFNPEEWTTIYKFPYIRTARIVQRMKIVQTAFTTCIALPGTLGMYLFGATSLEYMTFMLALSTLACTMLYVMGTFCSRLIGFMYVSKTDPTLVRVAHMNFWGNREDHLFKKGDFVPFSELPDNVRDAYVNVKFYFDPDSTMHICVRYGEIHDKMEFIEIFGHDCGIHVPDNANHKSKISKSKEKS